MTALALLGHDTAALDSYTDALACDPAVAALRDRVTVEAVDTVAETAARVTFDTAAGPLIAGFDLDTPLPLAERAQRIRRKAAALLGPDGAEAAWRAVEGGTVAEIAALLGPV